jgi:hypothetical protein
MALLEDLRTRLRSELGFELERAEEIDPGTYHNNRLLVLTAADGGRTFTKLYVRDDRNRLEREFSGLTLLRDRGLDTVPRPLLMSDEHNYGVYSLEAGSTASVKSLTLAHVTALGRFAGQVHRIRLAHVGARFPPAVNASFSFADGLASARRRLAGYSAFAASLDAFPQVQALEEEQSPREEIERLLAAVLAGLTEAQIEARVPESDWRLSWSDFAPHNVLLRPADFAGEPICAVDFEYFGWDEPAALAAGFITADTALGLAPDLQAAFLDAYYEHADHNPSTRERLTRLCALMHVAWCTVHLGLCTPERIAIKQFASPGLDVETMVTEQIAKFKRRADIAREFIRQHFA